MQPSVVIGIDYGTKQIGLAVGETLCESITGLKVISAEEPQLWSALDKVHQQWQPEAWVVGLPLTSDGQDQKITKLVRLFAQNLKQRYDKDVHLVDERWSSAEARARLKNQRSEKKHVDVMSAVVILEQWLGVSH